LAVVAPQSIAVLIALLSVHWHQQLRLDASFVSLSLWLWGGMLYVWIAGLIFARLVSHRVTPGDFTPSYWINMGAMAISVLAGSLLVANAPDEPFLQSLRPFLEGLTVLYWATGTWWIPLLAILTVWRHTRGRVPLAYDALWWSAVFPLGMYAVGTDKMAAALGLDFLDAIPQIVFWLALTAWLATFAAMIRGRARAGAPAVTRRVSDWRRG
jgi:tellurite resistance protein TehA-like permease